MASLLGDRGDEVSPLELFFDLVFVFAVSQLSEHLVEDVSWRSGAETLVMLVAVFSIWSFTSFGVSFPQGGRLETPSILVVLVLALFVNAAVPRAFAAEPWVFVVPFLICLVGQVVFALATASTGWLRAHYRSMLVWVVVEAALWIVGALVEPEARLLWWAVAALLNVVGAWAAHPVPGRRFRSREVPFEPSRMVERSRLLLLIALGETVLTIGTAVSVSPTTVLSTVAAVLALVSTAALWFLYFGGSDSLVNESAASAGDRLRVARIAVNSQLVVLAGLIALAVANELAIEEPAEAAPLPLAVVMHLGPVLYLGAQAWYLHALGGRWSRPRVLGVVALAVTVPVSLAVPAVLAVALVAAVLVAVVVGSRTDVAAPAAPQPA